jgi:MYXO-CTERM domain-containing protein
MIQLLTALAVALALTMGPAAYHARSVDDTGAAPPAGGVTDTGAEGPEGVAGAASMAGEPGGCGCHAGRADHGSIAALLILATALRRRAR